MKSGEFEFIRKRQQHLMPEFMKEFDLELNNTKQPSEYNLTKYNYIKSWLSLFDKDLVDELNSDYHIEKFSRFNVLQLKTAFQWTIGNFAELDLGGNHKWYSITITILKNLTKSSWNTEAENKLMEEYITDTRWYDY